VLRFSAERSAEIVAESFRGCADERLRDLLAALVRHLHDFAKEIELTQHELDAAISFLTRTGQVSSGTRQEFVLLSDVLGLSMLVDAIANRAPAAATASTVLGPFHLVDSPPRQLGASIALASGGDPALVTGRVLGADASPLAGALIDVWQADAQGFYDVQRPGEVPERNLRGLFTADDEGRFWFRSIVPAAYPIPDDGPVGTLLNATGRHPWRPAHIHFIVKAAGHMPLTTHIFVAGSPYLDSDAVFGVKDSLIVDFREATDPALAARYGMPGPFRHAHIDLRLGAAR
jgi:catechol 1,2-dioxygenase